MSEEEGLEDPENYGDSELKEALVIDFILEIFEKHTRDHPESFSSDE